MNVNPRIACDQIIVKDSRGDTFACRIGEEPAGAVIVAVGPSRAALLAQLAAMGNAAAHLIAEAKQ